MGEQRLHKFLAQAGVGSRRACERLIEEGRVAVNGRVIRELGTKVDPERDHVRFDGARVVVRQRPCVVVALHKPRGYVTTVSDPEGRPTVMDLVRDVRGRIYPVGRLDFHSDGLLLLTDDGDLARDLMHPGCAVPKTYRVKVRGTLDDDVRRRLERGIDLDGRRTLPAIVRPLRGKNPGWIEVTVTEGRNRLIRRMLLAVGLPVRRLRRTRFGPIALGRLAPGEHRVLRPAEVESLREAASGRRPPRKRGTRRRGSP